jgi:indolepyruvate decarboxylase
MAEARAPTLLLDAEVGRFGLTDPVIALIQAHSIPFATLPSAKALIDEAHELHLGTYRGAGSAPEVRAAIEEADCLLCISVRLTDAATGIFSHRLRSEEIIHIRAFGVTIGMDHYPWCRRGGGVERLGDCALPIRSLRILPPRAKPPRRLPPQFARPLIQKRF